MSKIIIEITEPPPMCVRTEGLLRCHIENFEAELRGLGVVHTKEVVEPCPDWREQYKGDLHQKMFDSIGHLESVHGDINVTLGPNLTKREYFAAMAMQGEVTRRSWNLLTPIGLGMEAKAAVRAADALIEALKE